MDAKIPDEKMLVKIRYRKIILPSTYDVSEGDWLVLTRSACTPYGLALYTQDTWIAIRDKLWSARPSDGPTDAMRYLIGHAEDCLVEKGGIRISPDLLGVTELQREAIWIPRANRVEIWHPKVDVQCTSLMIDQASGLSV